MSHPVTGVFVNPKESYKRDIDPVRHYIDDAAAYLHISTGRPIEQCREFVTRKVEQTKQDPEVMYLERNQFGDREQKIGTLMNYLDDSIKERQLIAGTLTTYMHPRLFQSPYVKFIDDNVKKRGIHKKAMFRAEQAGDKVTYVIEKNNQANKKISNNSLSGAHNSGGTPLFNKTAHSTLTSTCRITSGYGNANNERMVAGNRHYRSPDITLNNLVSIVNNTDYEQLATTMNRWGLVCPSAENIMEMVERCTRNYWRNRKAMAVIETFVYQLSDIQRAAALYTGDLYSLSLYNGDMVRKFILKLAMKVHSLPPGEDAEAIMKNSPEDFVNLAKQICAEETRGLEHINNIKGTDKYERVAATANNICNVILEYGDFIRCFFVTSNLPPSLAHLPSMVREVAITSDTDSTIFTVERWVVWTNGKLGFSDHDNAVAATMIFLASQSITHILAIMSANFGVVTERIHQVAMKNEFYFLVFVATQMTKHYYATIQCQEGNVFAKRKTEIKGVHMKSSTAPKHINDRAKETMEEIMDTIIRGEKIKAMKYLKEVGDMERQVFGEIAAGHPKYFRRANIKQPESYTKSETESPYSNYTFWTDVFQDKYGACPPPPYDGIRISLTTDTPGKMREYLAGLEDRALADRMVAWMARHNKSYIGSIILSREVIALNGGIPKEIMDAMDTRGMMYNICTVFYHILETLGIYSTKKGTNLPVLVSDYY